MRTILDRAWGPVALAVGLAIAFLPVVAGALMVTGAPDYEPLPQLSFRDVFVLAAVSSLAAAIIGGAIGGALIRRHRVVGPLAATILSWMTAVTLVPLVASVIGIHYQAVVFCLDSCQVIIDSALPSSGFSAALQSAVFGIQTVIPIGVFLLFTWGANRAARQGSNGGAAALAVLAFASLNWMGFLVGGATMTLPFVVLSIGVVIWASVLHATAAQPAGPELRPAG
jgi:hypothetical protein